MKVGETSGSMGEGLWESRRWQLRWLLEQGGFGCSCGGLGLRSRAVQSAVGRVDDLSFAGCARHC